MVQSLSSLEVKMWKYEKVSYQTIEHSGTSATYHEPWLIWTSLNCAVLHSMEWCRKIQLMD